MDRSGKRCLKEGPNNSQNDFNDLLKSWSKGGSDNESGAGFPEVAHGATSSERHVFGFGVPNMTPPSERVSTSGKQGDSADDNLLTIDLLKLNGMPMDIVEDENTSTSTMTPEYSISDSIEWCYIFHFSLIAVHVALIHCCRQKSQLAPTLPLIHSVSTALNELRRKE
jgi:hypothetical protein